MEQKFAVNNYDYRRFHERKKYPAEIVFHHANRLYAGSLKDVSLGGAYIETYCVNQFSTKDIVTISIPFSFGQNNVKRRGSILWLNNAGFGVEFI
ncbi:PilZ domain-containing protein [Desulfosarcina sp.]|uniref:PilZ domain-containing protein n=1 Tax=Desulfosarcina sp. TaxID=2027861 RepID=UPI0029B3DDC0|nr:PilZ domain-containing protein [Desulfosarcina sp.]MDX2453212.1 PilZ domain-containing protein [Desulfosarcina sp.]MDX2490938.1 PilZ domain-containing protein [Desulfosarcina sp.]